MTHRLVTTSLSFLIALTNIVVVIMQVNPEMIAIKPQATVARPDVQTREPNIVPIIIVIEIIPDIIIKNAILIDLLMETIY